MCNFDIYVMHFVFTGFFRDPKFGTLHLGLHTVLLSLISVD